MNGWIHHQSSQGQMDGIGRVEGGMDVGSLVHWSRSLHPGHCSTGVLQLVDSVLDVAAVVGWGQVVVWCRETALENLVACRGRIDGWCRNACWHQGNAVDHCDGASQLGVCCLGVVVQ